MSGRAGEGSGRAGDGMTYRIGDRGDRVVPRKVLDAIGLGAKMRVRFRVEGKTLVIEKAFSTVNPLDGPLTRIPDRDLFSKIAGEQAERKNRQSDAFGDRVKDAAADDEPPEHPFRAD